MGVREIPFIFVGLLVQAYKWVELQLMQLFRASLEKRIRNTYAKLGVVFDFDSGKETNNNNNSSVAVVDEKYVSSKSAYKDILRVKVHDKVFFTRAANSASMGMGETYMDGSWDCDDLTELFRRIMREKIFLEYLNPWNRFLNYAHLSFFNLQTESKAWEVGKQHYDLAFKMKGKGKDKPQRTPTRNDEMSIASKANKLAKDKEKLRPRHASGKRSIGAKITPTQTILDVDHVVVDSHHHDNSHENSQTALHDSFRLKGKKARSKDCEEAISSAVADFWDSAWNICAERFFITSAPVTVSFELRNAWLRIAEAEWQDLDMRETPNTRPNRIFKRDEPPLPLAFDTWSRGAMELLPRYRHESVMDPFLRDLFAPTFVDQSEILRSSEEMDDEEEDEEEENSHEDVKDGHHDEDEAGDRVEILVTPETHDKDNWRIELDDEYKLMRTETREETPPKTESLPKLSDDSQEETIADLEPPVMFILSPRSISVEESVTDVDSSAASRAISAYSSRKSQVKRKFSPSQCGGRVGSGVFRFPTETTSEAVRRMRENIRDHHIQSHVQIIDGDRVAYKQKRSLRDDDDMVVQPLFEEQTPRSAGHEIANRFHELSWRGVSYAAGQSSASRGASVDNVAADMDKKFLQRKLVNLQTRFKKQSIKYFGHNTKTVEETEDAASAQGSRKSSTSSSFRSKTSKRGGGADKRKVTRGVSMKYPSHVGIGGNVMRTPSHLRATGSRAKGTTSDPGLMKRNKEPLFSSLLERRLKAGIFDPASNNQKSGGLQFSHTVRGGMEVLDPEIMRNKRSQYCKTCQTTTNTSSS
ncbi:Cyclopropane-fatty-acyl-phospholipid synthase [Orchesella cincta]|uniref:Cyclopropane-fatty-acyl-phospholipid synthase n=1 Tax=Orchesella cincta TaxID=48709 RepID=A0A1D2MZL8_ORCCI|nr:Cyclopropane-fatty-acyl-phospholipid synthase [Orchesella cincta]